MDITIRHAKPTDIKSLVGLLKELFEIEGFVSDENKQSKGLALLLESKKNCVVLAEYHSEVIGMCTIQTLISTAEGSNVGLIEDVIVKNEYAGKGVGRKLILEIERWAHSQGLTRLQLLAVHDNQPALNFYAKMDWVETSMIGLRKVI
ncbi:MAG: GNAT family N-acetyltransferase [Gammaproteobacteria bacterium]|nr:MAG: GNAT family N-acetyltransferase [Gammaproteobacteria bacterium]